MMCRRRYRHGVRLSLNFQTRFNAHPCFMLLHFLSLCAVVVFLYWLSFKWSRQQLTIYVALCFWSAHLTFIQKTVMIRTHGGAHTHTRKTN